MVNFLIVLFGPGIEVKPRMRRKTLNGISPLKEKKTFFKKK